MKITLLHPEHETVTAPLQLHGWPVTEIAEPDETVKVPIAWDALTRSEAADRSLPRPLTFSWEVSSSDGENVTFELQLATDEHFRRPIKLTQLRAMRATIRHLHLDTRYYWKVLASEQNRTIAESSVRTVITHSAPPRWIHAPGMTNVRDMGGWPLQGGGKVRQGLLYRTSEMNAHLFINDEGKRVLLEELGIRTDLDLRGADENPEPALPCDRVRWLNIPVRPYADICRSGALGKTGYQQVFSILAQPDKYPLLFHCWGGADRAGTVAFLLGALLGISLDDLIRDYELTSLSVWGPRLRNSEEFSGLLYSLRRYAPQSTIREQVENYLTDIGVTPEEMSAIRQWLIT